MRKADIEKAKPGTVLYDSHTRGLHLRILDNRRCWFFRYRTKERIERRPKLGEWPTLSLSQAREMANRMLREVDAGGDPMARRIAAIEAPTVTQLCDAYLEGPAREKKTAREDRRLIERHIRPRLGKERVMTLNTRAVLRLRDALKDTPIQANRCLALLSKMMDDAIRWGLREDRINPVKGADRFKENERHRYATRDELTAILGRLEKDFETRPRPVAFVALLLFTGARPSEIAGARPEHRDGDRLVLWEHKTDRKREPRTIYLPAEACWYLDRLPVVEGETLLGIKSPRAYWDKLCEDEGIEDLRLYDLRHTFASYSVAENQSLAQIGGLLGHRSAASTRRYAHLITETGRAAAGQTAAAIRGSATPNNDKEVSA